MLFSLDVYQQGVREMGKAQSQAGTVKVPLGVWHWQVLLNLLAGSGKFSRPSPGRQIHFCCLFLLAAVGCH